MSDRDPSGITPDELAALQRIRSKQRIEDAIGPILERRQCAQWGIPYDEDSPTEHQTALRERWVALRDVFEQHQRNSRWLGAAGRTLGAGARTGADRVINLVTGALVLLGLGWVASKLGLKLPGGLG